MALTELPDGYVSDSFEITENGYTLCDAIVMPKDQYDALTPEEIQAMKQQRFDNWYAIVTAVPDETPAEPSVDQEEVQQ